MRAGRLIIGLGTGRCGTTSLARLLARQQDTTASHEKYGNKQTWIVGHGQTKPLIEGLLSSRNEGVVADVSFSWLNYVEKIHGAYPDTRFVCLRRERAGFIESYKKLMRGRNNLLTWRANMGFPLTALYGYEHCLPKYDHLRGQSEDMIFGFFYDQYDQFARELEHSLDSFAIFPMEALNTESGVREILDHCGYDDSIKVIRPGIRANTSR